MTSQKTLRVLDSDGAEHAQVVEPQNLSDAARSALAQWPLGYVAALTLVSKTPLRDQLGATGVGERARLMYSDTVLAAPVIKAWSGWSPWAGPHKSAYATPLEYLEAELKKIDAGWWVDELVHAGEAAKMAGASAATWRGYVSRGQAPAPDEPGDLSMPARSRRPRWRRSTIARWMAERPGSGSRTDLRARSGT